MVESAAGEADMCGVGIAVTVEPDWCVVCLRHIAGGAEFAAASAEFLGASMPPALKLARFAAAGNARGAGAGAEVMLAWRSPSETLLLTRDAGLPAALAAHTLACSDGHAVDQTGGFRVLRVTGERGADLLLRLGSAAAIPLPGDARTGRLAELSVMALGVQAGEILLVVERVHGRHLTAWIRATVADF